MENIRLLKNIPLPSPCITNDRDRGLAKVRSYADSALSSQHKNWEGETQASGCADTADETEARLKCDIFYICWPQMHGLHRSLRLWCCRKSTANGFPLINKIQIKQNILEMWRCSNRCCVSRDVFFVVSYYFSYVSKTYIHHCLIHPIVFHSFQCVEDNHKTWHTLLFLIYTMSPSSCLPDSQWSYQFLMSRGRKWFCDKVCRILRGVYVGEDNLRLLLFVMWVMVFYRNVFGFLFGNSSCDKLECSLIIRGNRNSLKSSFRVPDL